MAEQIRILHVFGNMNLGGAESRIMDLYRHMDRNHIQFDFLVHTNETCYFDNEIEKLGGRIYRVPRFRIYNYFTYRKAIKNFFAGHHDFAVVQGHMTSTAAIYLPVAKKSGVSVVVAHARSAGVDRGLKGIATRFMRRNLSSRADYLFTCSRLAGISVFGKKAVEEGRCIFVPNAIDCNAFSYDEGKRQQIRKELRIEDKYVIGHVGRFHYAKNHEYLLQIFAALDRMEKEDGQQKKDYVLLLLGEGEGMEPARELAKKLKIQDKVIFAGNKGNVYDYYQAMDYFVYPSRFEGLPGTMVEAQTAGLRCLMSESICEEVVVTELVKTMSIEQPAEEWARYIRGTQDYERYSHVKEMEQAGFDVSAQTEIMTNFYKTGVWE